MGWLRLALLILIARPLARLVTGLDVLHAERLPSTGPAIIAANHSSHVDTWLLLSLFPARTLAKVRPVAAADYFLANPAISWFSRQVIGIVPVERRRLERGVDVLAPAKAALAAGDILVIFPEGTRGADPDHMAALKPGVAMLASEAPATPVIPVWIQGAGRVLPKGSWLAAPLTCCVVVGEALYWTGERMSFMTALRGALEALAAEAPPLRWSEKATGEQI